MLKLKKIEVKKNKDMENKPTMDEEMMSYPPSFSANEKQIPEIVDCKVGEKYKIVLEIEMKRMSSYDNGTKKSTDASFDVLAYQMLDDKKSVDDMSDEEIEAMQGEGLKS